MGGTNMTSSDDINFFGLTEDEYQILLEDINQAVEEGNRKYGFGEPEYIGAKSKPRPIPKVNPMPTRTRTRRRRIEELGPLLEEVMLARGLLYAVKRRSVGK
jgi:hypothetical protein